MNARNECTKVSYEVVRDLIVPLLDGAIDGAIEWDEAAYNTNDRLVALGWTMDEFATAFSNESMENYPNV